MDFITRLPKTEGKVVLLVVIDRLSKYAHFSALPPKFTAITIAHIFTIKVIKLHGTPHNIISDCDPIFIINF